MNRDDPRFKLGGRPKTTGRFKTRAELEAKIKELYLRNPYRCTHRIGRFVGTTASTVARILAEVGLRPLEKGKYKRKPAAP